MPRNWWTRKNLVLAATVITLTCAVSFVAMGLSYPEPVPNAALGPDWECSRLAFVFTTCNRVKHTQAVSPVRVTRVAACTRLRT
jgi:hypothetical protein